MRKVEPQTLNFTNRFDVFIKYLFIKSIELNYQTSFYEDMYRNHLSVWNGFSEYDNANKNNYQAFRSTFINIMQSIKNEGYLSEKPAVPIIKNSILNGAHRLASCLYYDKPINVFDSTTPSDGQFDCSWYYFSSLCRNNERIWQKYADRAALEFVDMFNNTKLVCLFPSATKKGGLTQIRKMLHEEFGVFYEKHIPLNRNGSINLMRELYASEQWAESNNGLGYREKASLCFETQGIPLVLFIVRMDDKAALNCKEKIRNVYNIGKHSVHINDTWDESKRIARALLNENSIHFLNHSTLHTNPALLKNFREKLFEYVNNEVYLATPTQSQENNCLTASIVLQAYGLRNANDIDYIYRTTKLNGSLSDSTHNQYLKSYYECHADEILFNPQFHFYHQGVKFLSHQKLLEMKKRRAESKDFDDIKMLRELL